MVPRRHLWNAVMVKGGGIGSFEVVVIPHHPLWNVVVAKIAPHLHGSGLIGFNMRTTLVCVVVRQTLVWWNSAARPRARYIRQSGREGCARSGPFAGDRPDHTMGGEGRGYGHPVP